MKPRRPTTSSGPFWRGYIRGQENGTKPENPYPDGPDADEWARGLREGERRRQALNLMLRAEVAR